MKNQNNRYALQYINDGDVCAEIGVWQGHLSRKILRRNPSELHLIDPWMTQNVIERCYSIAQDEMEKIYRQVYNNFNKLNLVLVESKRYRSDNMKEKIINVEIMYINIDLL